MGRRVRLGVVALLIGVALVQGSIIGFLFLRDRWRARVEGTPVVRGRAVAERLGCFGCHGPGGIEGIPNPGARISTVPSWSGGTWMMFNDEVADVRAWILDGHPADREPDSGALISMPAYRGQIDDPDLDDLTAYVLAVSQFGWPEDSDVVRGRDLAIRLGCFGCHGPEGRGLVTNPLSFKGYIPPWTGSDYEELVGRRAEFDEWVRDGATERFRRNPAARRFLERQLVKMPAYGDLLGQDDLDALYAFVEWVRTNPRGEERP